MSSRGWRHWFRLGTPLEEARRQLRQAQLNRLEAASMRESWAGFERTLAGRIKRLESVITQLESEEQ